MTEPTPLEVTCQQTKAKLDAGSRFVFLDCREPDEYATAKIAGTTLIPMSQLADRVGELELVVDPEGIEPGTLVDRIRLVADELAGAELEASRVVCALGQHAAADKALLKSVLEYHVVSGAVNPADAKNGNLKTVQGANVAVAKAGTFVTVEDAVVQQADVRATNGVVHVIDKVLMPPKR